MDKIFLTLIILGSLVGCNETVNNNGKREFIPEPDANPVTTTAEVIAYKNGIDNWKNVSEIAFTFNVDRGEKHFDRSWIWHPKTDDVTRITNTDTLHYNRREMDSIARKADQGFINDKYWLLAPFNLVWDKNVTFSEIKKAIAPISKDTLNQLTVVYGDQGGYTPGDAYDFFYAKDFIIKEWVFREGNDSLPSMTTTWENYERFNGILISKMHADSTRNFKLHFTNISVK